eukprot:CAMPEP_0115189120 /NCGR_PEP_ID=MMETSP0270-20121206/11357_1 /TAXON_ID=71861 /ORGANISM="Scrippsiella trochoidea, Strain CCMP3099" /LENGTH=454 /DNA_ID=CAMNT_0002602313 /DNA_START=64 /DNA_END=1428 /DNA_ORIENTATION=-
MAEGGAELMMNGFRIMPEKPCLEVKDEKNIAPFSLPVEAFSFKPQGDAIITQFKNGDRERKIHCNIELEEQELDQLSKLQEAVRQQGLQFLPSIAAMATRYLSRARGDPTKAIKLMQATQEWRLSYFQKGPISDSDVAEDMKHGIVYFSGRDSALRPAIIIRAIRIPQQWYKEKRVDKLINILIFSMEYMMRYMLLPGTIENNVLIVDLKGLSWTQVPLSALSEVYKVMSHHYSGRVFRFYICNLSAGLSLIASAAKNILTDRQKQKLVFLDDVKDLRKDFALHQLEEDLGGSRPSIKEFFPFPLQAGPFSSGCDKGVDAAAVPEAHTVLTKKGFMGRLWDGKMSRSANLRLDFAPEAADWFQSKGLPLPAGLQQQVEGGSPSGVPADENPKEEGLNAGIDNVNESVSNNAGSLGREGEVDKGAAQPVVIAEAAYQDEAVQQRGFFSCTSCWCS